MSIREKANQIYAEHARHKSKTLMILQMILEGKSAKEIADLLNIDVQTVRNAKSKYSKYIL